MNHLFWGQGYSTACNIEVAKGLKHKFLWRRGIVNQYIMYMSSKKFYEKKKRTGYREELECHFRLGEEGRFF